MVDRIRENKKVLFLVVLFALAIFFTLFMLSRATKSSDEVKIDNGKISLNDISLTKEGTYKFDAKLSVNTDTELDIKTIDIKFYNNTKKELITLVAYVDRKVEKGEQVEITAYTDYDLSTQKSISYIVHYNETEEEGEE